MNNKFALPLSADLSVSYVVFNDTTLKLEETETGYTITAQRGSDVQKMEIPKGNDGTSVTITGISQSVLEGGSSVVTFSDGSTLTVKNGEKGNAGYTPVKGVDYFTAADQEILVQQVIAALPDASEVSY